MNYDDDDDDHDETKKLLSPRGDCVVVNIST